MSTQNNNQNNGLTPEQQAMLAELEALRAENAQLKTAAKVKALGGKFKVSEKTGAVSVYGLGRFPVTLYKSQWIALEALLGDLKVFMEANAGLIKDKAAKDEAKDDDKVQF